MKLNNCIYYEMLIGNDHFRTLNLDRASFGDLQLEILIL